MKFRLLAILLAISAVLAFPATAAKRIALRFNERALHIRAEAAQ